MKEILKYSEKLPLTFPARRVVLGYRSCSGGGEGGGSVGGDGGKAVTGLSAGSVHTALPRPASRRGTDDILATVPM